MSLSVALVNVRSLIRNFDPFYSHVAVSTYDIVGVTETWLHADAPNDVVNIGSYSCVRQDRPATIRGGGVGLYIKQDISFKVIINDYKETIEQLWVEIKHRNRVHAVGIIYRTSSSRDYLSFFNSFEETLIQIHLRYDSVICFGDFNIDMLKPNDINVGRLLAIADTFELKQFVNEPTRISRTSLSILDLVLANCDCDIDLGTHELNIADHRCVYFKINFGVHTVSESGRVTYRDLSTVDNEEFQYDLRIANWNIMYNMDNVDDKVLFLNENILKTLEKHSPLKTVTLNKKYAPWITPAIKIMQRLRDNALKRFKQTKNPAHWDYYKQLRNHTNNAIHSEKKAYLKHKFESCDAKQKWRELKKLNITREKSRVIPNHLADVNALNKFFVDSDPGSPDDELLNSYSNSPRLTADGFVFSPVTRDTVSKIIMNLKSGATGCDEININILQLCCPFLIPHITHIINCCLETSVFPLVWKKAIVYPLPKTRNPTEFSHLRSISILPTLSKVLEKVLEIQIREFLNSKELIPPKQSGFRANYSCTTALCNVTDDIFRASDAGKVTVLILLDYSKAFDMINHKMLISILGHIGFKDNAIKLVSSYLMDRSQVVTCNNRISESLKIEKGVPQGSILGPLLFTIYTSCFHKCLKNCNYHLYADDTQLYCSFPPSEMNVFCQMINQDLERLFKCAQKHGLKINPAKSTVIVFGSKSHRIHLQNVCSFIMGGEVVPFKEHVKNLGLIVDNDLRFRVHVNNLLRKAYVSLKMIYPHRRCLAREVKILLCDSLVLSHFNYCDSVYGPCLDSDDVRRIQKAQNSCLRFIYGIRRPQRISHKLGETRWLSMYNRRQLHMACFYTKIMIDKTPPYLFEKLQFRTDVHNLNIRRRDILTIPKHRKEFFKRSYSYRAAHLVNKIHKLNNQCTPQSYRQTKRIFRQHLLDTQ